MTKRYFYTDPLAAAWMTKHFGMTFHVLPTPEQVQEYDSDRPWTWQETYCFPAVEMIGDCLDALEKASSKRIFIDQQSQHLLEPRAGDCGWFHTLGLARIIRVTEDAIFTDVCGDKQRGQTRDSLFRIFMRLSPCAPYETHLGKADRRFIEFMWPESEPANG